MPDTVKLHVVIAIDVDEQVDTGLSVDEWNGLGDVARQEVVDQIWNTASQRDTGGIRVMTEGAIDV